jgi:chorismate mutase
MINKTKKQLISNIRSKIDHVDEKILPLIIKRFKLVEQALSLKTKRSEIIDRKRINQILNKIEKKSKKVKTNPKLIKSIWMSMIQSFIRYEKKEFNKKK